MSAGSLRVILSVALKRRLRLIADQASSSNCWRAVYASPRIPFLRGGCVVLLIWYGRILGTSVFVPTWTEVFLHNQEIRIFWLHCSTA